MITLSSDTQLKYLVALIVTFILKVTILDFVAAGDIHVSQTHLVFNYYFFVQYNLSIPKCSGTKNSD